MRNLGALALTLFGACFFAPAIVKAEDKIYQKPRLDDVRLDWCWSWKVKDCGKRVADMFCARRHFTDARDFRAENAGGHTRFIGSNESCNDKGCLGFAFITCRGQVNTGQGCDGAAASVALCHDQNPVWKGERLDRCLEPGKRCDGEVAKAYCRSKGFDDFAYYRTDSAWDGVPTKSMGTNQVCNGSHCRGFQVIRCKRIVGGPKKTPTDSNAIMSWPFKSEYKFVVEVRLFSQSRAVTWPGQNEVYKFDDSKRYDIDVKCNIGEKICYGAWSGDRYWGGGRDGSATCKDCCRTCKQGKVEQTTLVR